MLEVAARLHELNIDGMMSGCRKCSHRSWRLRMRFSGIGSPDCELGSRQIGSIDSACMRMAPWESMKGPRSETRRGHHHLNILLPL